MQSSLSPPTVPARAVVTQSAYCSSACSRHSVRLLFQHVPLSSLSPPTVPARTVVVAQSAHYCQCPSASSPPTTAVSQLELPTLRVPASTCQIVSTRYAVVCCYKPFYVLTLCSVACYYKPVMCVSVVYAGHNTQSVLCSHLWLLRSQLRFPIPLVDKSVALSCVAAAVRLIFEFVHLLNNPILVDLFQHHPDTHDATLAQASYCEPGF